MERAEVHDSVFGPLRWYADGSFYGGEMLLGDGYELLVSFDPKEGELAAMLPAAHEALRWVLQNDERVRRLAAEQFTDEFNRQARDPKEEPEPISREEFARRIRLGSCWFYPDGHVELEYDEAHMFGGHAIKAKCDPVSSRIAVDK